MRRISIPELAAESGISTRSIAKYVADGLLPAAHSEGVYGEGHLQRLRLIALLLAERLPIAAIRASVLAMDDGEVARTLAAKKAAEPPPRTQSTPAYKPK